MPVTVPPRQDSIRFILIIIVIYFIYNSSDSSNSSDHPLKDIQTDYASQTTSYLSVLNSSRWHDFNPYRAANHVDDESKFLNLTGFRENDGYRGWERLGAWKERSAIFRGEACGGSERTGLKENVFFQNITGVVQGKWVRYEANLTGHDKINWPRINLSEIAPSVRWESDQNQLWSRNISGNNGKIRMRFDEKETDVFEMKSNGADETPTGPVRQVAATVTLHDEASNSNGWNMRIHGVHWPKLGVIFMTTTSEKFAGIFGLPHLMSDPYQYLGTQKLLNQTLWKTFQNFNLASKKDYRNPWSSIPEDEAALLTPHCEYLVFAQVYPFPAELISSLGDENSGHIVQEIENELRYPNGAPTSKTPDLKMSTVILSPDCGFIIESKGPPSFATEDGEHLMGKKHEVLLQSIQNWLKIFAVVLLIQTLLLKAQSKDASTPSTVSRVSLHTIFIMLFADAFVFGSLSLLSGTSPNLFPSALLVSFMSLMSVMLGIRFLSAIWNSQEPERREHIRQQTTESVAHSPSIESVMAPQPGNLADNAILPSSTTTPSRLDNNPIIVPSDQDIDAEMFENDVNPTPSLLPNTNPNASLTSSPSQPQGVSFATMYIRSVLLLTLILFLTLTSTSWPAWLRKTYIYPLSALYLSFPSFQIRRNIRRNCRKALLWKFVIGQSILRLTPFSYFYLKKDNMLYTATDGIAFCVLAVWLWIQCWILVAQNILGPRWGLPKTWYVEGWNYHPILRNSHLESGELPIGLASNHELSPSTPNSIATSFTSSDESRTQGRKESTYRSVDCAICMQILEVPVFHGVKDTTTFDVSSILETQRYMVTPCRHIFHTTCLEGWMRFRLQCPICRENLPPL